MFKQHLYGEYIFTNFNSDLWRCVNRAYPGTPADLCDEFGIAVPDSAQFLRCLIDWCNVGLEFRHYAGRIRINIYKRR